MGEIRIVNRRGNKNRFPSSTETTNTTETIPETPSTPIQIQEDIKMMTKMTYEEIKNALAAGKVFSRVGKNKSRTEVKLREGKPIRRYISESGEVSDWAPAALNTMPRFEWEVSQSEPTTEVNPTTTIIKQVDLGDGTTTVITETVPVSEAPVVIDPFAIPLNKDNDTPEPEPIPEPTTISEAPAMVGPFGPKALEDLQTISKMLAEMREAKEEPETDNMPNPEPEEEEDEELITMSASLALEEMMMGHNVMWVPREKDHDLQVMFYRDWDLKFKEVRANSSHISERVDMNEFFEHMYVRVTENYDSFINCLSYISENDSPCYMRNIITGRIIKGPKCEDDSDAEADEDCNIYPTTPLEVGTILPIELRTFWVVEFGEVKE